MQVVKVGFDTDTTEVLSRMLAAGIVILERDGNPAAPVLRAVQSNLAAAKGAVALANTRGGLAMGRLTLTQREAAQLHTFTAALLAAAALNAHPDETGVAALTVVADALKAALLAQGCVLTAAGDWHQAR